VKRAPWTAGGRAYFAAWTRDYGDDNRLWYDSNYEYDQPLTEWRTDFNGDEMFVYMFLYDYNRNRFTPSFETAFSFYDPDGDSCSEEVLRFDGTGRRAENLRYSIDIDNDARGTNRHDYDFSLTSLGPIELPAETCMTIDLRGAPAGPVIRWEHMRRVAKSAKWTKTCLTWDENDNNVDPAKGRQHNERWEGVINHPSASFPQVGGPSCGAFNKRNEVDADNSGKFQFYYSPVDHRLHLYGAETGWIIADPDYNDRPDMIIRMEDTDGNGFFDTWRYDTDADSVFDREYRLTDDSAPLIPFDYDALHVAYVPALEGALDGNRVLIAALKAVLAERERPSVSDSIEEYFRAGLERFEPEFKLGEKIRASREGVRYYGDLIRERYWIRLAASSAAKHPRFAEIRRAYEAGDLTGAARLIGECFPSHPAPARFGAFSRRFTIELDNPSDLYLEHHPFVLTVADIRKQVSGFTPLDFVITEAEPLLDERTVPSQADDLDGDGVSDEVAFTRTLAPFEKVKLSCWYSSVDKSHVNYPQKTDALADWDSTRANIGWESNRCGYRLYYGQIDCFGKRRDRLILAGIDGASYHRIADWGMDILNVGVSSGLGGISIWEGDTRIPAMNPAGNGNLRITRAILSRGPVRALVRVNIAGIRSEKKDYTVFLLMSAFADNVFSRQDVSIVSSTGDSVVYSPGVEKLPHDVWFIDSDAGVLASWGRQEDEIGDIGLGLMFFPAEYRGFAESGDDRYVKLAVPSGARRTHWIISGWRKGLPSPVAPTGRDWANGVRELAARLKVPVKVVFSPE
jgi:hypothetical protein